MVTTTPSLGLYVQSNPPLEVGPKTLWVDTSLAGSRFPAHPGSTYIVTDGGNGVPQQEPNAWVYNGVIYLLVNKSGNSNLYTATDPRGPWTNKGNVMGSGVGGEAAGVIHPGLLIEGTTLYLYYIAASANTVVKCATATMANMESSPTTAFGGQVNVLSKAGGVLPGLTQFGNFAAIKVGNTYRLYYEATATGADSWQTGVAECSTPTGTFVVRTGVLGSLDPLFTFGTSRDIDVFPNQSSLQLLQYRSFGSCGNLVFENGQYTLIYHGGPIGASDGGPQSDIYRATSPDGINWSVDLWGYPAYPRTDHRFELDQVADPFVLNVNGVWWCFYTGASNPVNRFVIKACPLSPTMKMWDGSGWVALDQHPPALPQRGLIRRARTNDNATGISAFDDVVVDPSNTANFSQVLPAAAVGVEVGICNISTGTGTIAVTPRSGDTILGANAAIPPGQRVIFKCMYQNGGAGQWVRTGIATVAGDMVQAVTSATNATAINLALGNVITETLTENTTLGAPTNVPPANTKVSIFFTQNGTGGFTVAFNAAYIFPTAWSNTGNTANKKSVANFISDGTALVFVGNNSWY